VNGFSADGYWTKGLLFVNRAMEPEETRSEDERRLWASLALEQLAKWALAKTSPSLVADPVQGDGQQLFRALGLQEGGPYVSIKAATAFKRCAAIYRPFSSSEAIAFANARNEYLHGTEVAVLTLPAEAWWSRFWSLVNVLITAHQMVPEDLVGRHRIAEVEGHLSRNAQRITHQYEAAVEAARRNLARFSEGHMLADEARRWERAAPPVVFADYELEVPCPACGDPGTAYGSTADSTEVQWPRDHDELPMVEVTFRPDLFCCPTCHLELDDYEMLTEAGLDEALTIEVEFSDRYMESEYGND